MKCIVGLGNPGEKYEKNRHNIGFVVVDRLLAEITNNQTLNSKQFSNSTKFNSQIVQEKNFILAKPQTFMNDSGKAVVALTRFYKIDPKDLYVIHDDLDIALGKYKIQFGKGPQVHNGLLSIEQELGTDQFWNVRVGVENREVRGNKGVPGVVYSLQDFNPDEQIVVTTVVENVVSDMVRVVF